MSVNGVARYLFCVRRWAEAVAEWEAELSRILERFFFSYIDIPFSRNGIPYLVT